MKSLLHLFVCYILLSTLPFTAGAKTIEGLPSGEWLDVEIESNLLTHLEDLSESEKVEQIRDWIVLSFFNCLEIGQNEFFEAFFDFSPLRHDFKMPLVDFDFGESRAVSNKNGYLFIFVPHRSPKQKVLIARECDEYRLLYDEPPRNIHVIDYLIDVDEFKVGSFRLKESIKGTRVFSSEYGYLEKKVGNIQQLKGLLQTIDDVVFVRETGNGNVLFGGRKFTSFPTKSVDLEDLGTLYQAGNYLKEEFRKKYTERGLRLEYENQIAKLVEYSKLNPLVGSIPSYQIEAEIRSQYPYHAYFDEYLTIFLEQDLGLGFSLDHQLRHQSFASELRRVLNGDKAFLRKWFKDHVEQQVINSYLLWIKREKERWEEANHHSRELINNTLRSFNDLLENENSFHSFLHGSKAKKNLEYEQINEKLKKVYDVSEADIKIHLENYLDNLYDALMSNKNVLAVLADSISTKNELFFYKYKSYIEGFLPLELKIEQEYQDGVYFKDEKMLESLVLELAERGVSLIELKEFLVNTGGDLKEFRSFCLHHGIDVENYFEVTSPRHNKPICSISLF